MDGAEVSDFSGKVALLTGAASGLGADLARALSRRGATLILFDRDDDGLRTVGRDCPGSVTVCGDVSLSADVDRAVEAAVAAGQLSLVAAAAGIAGPIVPLVDLEEAAWNRLFDVNVKGTWLTLKATIPLLKATGGGSVVAYASAAGLVGSPALPAYAATKAAVISMVRTLARVHAPDGIRVNCVCPGSIVTPMLEEAFVATPDPLARRQREAEFIARHPLGRFGQPNEVTQAALFLLGEGASFVTGTALPVDGGRLA